MSRSNWKGFISFGLVSIPISLYTSKNKSADISFHQIDKKNNARIRYERINSTTGKSVPWENITRGYEFDKETIIPVPDEVLKKVAGEKSRTIEIEHFINKDELNLLTLENVYYSVPEKNGIKGYVILRNTLLETNTVGIAKVVISTKEYLSAIIPHENALMICLLKYDKEIKKPSEFSLPDKPASEYKIKPNEMKMAKQLIKSMTTKWRPEKYIDEYQKSIHQWVEESVNHIPHKKLEKLYKKPSTKTNMIDLLKKSLNASAKKKEKITPSQVAAHKVVKQKQKSAQRKVVH